MRRRTYALLLLLILVALPVLAQDGTPLPPLNLATNTPSNPALIPFATNTPAPTLPAPLPNVTPDAPIDFYALRLWTEQDIVELVEAQAQQAVIGRAGADLATQLTLYEMSRRYPRAPRDLAARESLARTLLSAPNVDARSVVRPVFTPGGNPPNGFTVTSQPVRLNQNEIADELLTVRGPNGYRDYIPVVDGTPLIPNGIPVAPFSGASIAWSSGGWSSPQTSSDPPGVLPDVPRRSPAF